MSEFRLPDSSVELSRASERIAQLEAERDRLKGQLCEWCAQGAPRDGLVSDKHRIPSHSGHGWEYPACGLFRSSSARITELKAERDRLRMALVPFAAFGDRLTGTNWIPDGCPVNADPGGMSELLVRAFRQAARVLAEVKP